jgi:DNA-binding response OmpR family regulator
MSEAILIIEDEILIALEMQRILEQHNHKVLGIAADIESALSYAEQEIALALVDLNLRDGLTGPQIGARLANEFQTSVLFVTATPRLLGDGVAGTIGVITKPTDDTSLLSAVEFALRLRTGQPVETPPCVRRFR